MLYATFSLTARCPRTGQFGVAVATRVPAVGAAVPHLRAGVGAIATHAWTNPYIGLDGLDLLSEGATADQVEEYAFVALRVDEHADPIPELHRVYAVWDEVFRPHLAARPTRADLGARAGSDRPQLIR